MKLEDWEEICPTCNGRGWYNKRVNQTNFSTSCWRCLSTGKLNWIEKIRGKDPNNVEKFVIRNNTKKEIIVQDLGINLEPNTSINVLDLIHEKHIRNSSSLDDLLSTKKLVIIENNTIEEKITW